MNFFRREFFIRRLGNRAFYRKWYGGRWVNYWSSISGPAHWLPLDSDHHIPSTAVGAIISEDYTYVH